jgi:hypothetical protein
MAAAILLRVALNQIGWTAIAATAFTAEGFEDISHIGLITGDFLHQVCKKLWAGTAAMSRTNQAAYDEIHNAVYTGKKRNFTFEHYIDKHAKAHQTLFEAGVEIQTLKKRHIL